MAVRLVNGRRPWLVASRRVPLPLHGAFSRVKYGACDRVLAVSDAVARGLVQGGLSSDRIRVVHDGVPDRLPPTDGADIAAEFGLPPGAPIIGSVAALSEHKDHATLLSAMPAVLEAAPDARLLIVGEGPLRPRLESHVRRCGLGGRCVFTGFRSDVDRLMPGFSLLCLTSYIEGLGSTLLDAMCFSRAIVATETGGTPEAVRHGKTGLLVPVGDSHALAMALVDLLTDRSRRESMGDAGRRRFVSEFTLARMVEETLGVYEDLCASAKSVAGCGRSRPGCIAWPEPGLTDPR
jgi:glycosyltransferase involved in cell wall biosynthesis